MTLISKHRIELPRCQCGVYRPSIENGDIDECGEPAIAVWNWDGDPLYVCEKHDDAIIAQEEKSI